MRLREEDEGIRQIEFVEQNRKTHSPKNQAEIGRKVSDAFADENFNVRIDFCWNFKTAQSQLPVLFVEQSVPTQFPLSKRISLFKTTKTLSSLPRFCEA